MGTLPLLLKNPDILLVGGGSVALQKARVLVKNHISFTLVAEEICSEIKQLEVTISQQKFTREHLKNFSVIVDASGNKEVSELILKEKKQRFILYNCVDQPDLCDFYFSSLLNYGHLKIAVSTDGYSPALGQVVRDKISTVIPVKIETLIEEAGQERSQGIINSAEIKEQGQKLFATVYLIGCGPGDVELLTLKAYQTIQLVDIVIYDHLITPEILGLIPQYALKIQVENRQGEHSNPQEKIKQILYEQAKSGLKVAHLLSGEPHISGRGAEEAEYLISRGIQVEVINGISSTVTGPS